MNNEIDFRPYLPQLLGNSEYFNNMVEYLGEDYRSRLTELVTTEQKNSSFVDTVSECARDVFDECATTRTVLSLGWDSNGPGGSGAVWVQELAGVCMVCSSDYDPEGPFDSIEEALYCDCFCTTTSRAEVDSDHLDTEQLLEIASAVYDWENGGDILINGRRYRGDGDKLSPQTPAIDAKSTE